MNELSELLYNHILLRDSRKRGRDDDDDTAVVSNKKSNRNSSSSNSNSNSNSNSSSNATLQIIPYVCTVISTTKGSSKNQYRCIHDRDKYTCKDCGGSKICQHKRIRSTCKDCGGGVYVSITPVVLQLWAPGVHSWYTFNERISHY